MTTATSVFVTEPGDGSVLALQTHDLPEPVTGEVQIEVAAAGVNFIDVYKRQGVYPVPTPFVLGEEGAGTVVSVGPGVSGIQAGDRVAWCQSSGSQSTVVNKPAGALVPVPDGLDLEVAAAVMLQGLTAHYLVNSTYAVEPGDIALVHAAAGGVGQLLVQMITAKGGTVVATAGSPEKLEIAGQLGAQHLIDYTDVGDLAAAVRTVAPQGVDVVYDGVGRSTFDASLASLRPRGMMVLFGGASGQVPPFDLQRLNSGGSLFVTRPTLVHYVADRKEYEWRAGEVLGSVADGSLKIDIGGRYALVDAAAAYEAMEGRHTTGKLILVPNA
ncbi:MAG: quinone oxidoreductase [Humibacillus sp.]|nr:quinone oxidoreductase [Humibacillus sp.]MDN5776229.1 quinone oxidoreductase [Humibacillus sp.]